jgi:hypothetical protein
VKTTPAKSTTILTDFKDVKDHDKKFDYRQVIGKLLYLEKSTRPDISCAVHQCARFCANQKMKNAEAVKRIGRYLLAIKDKGLIMKPYKEGMECWVDASHASEWSGVTNLQLMIQTQPDQEWVMLSPMQAALCIGHQRCRQR